MINQPSHRYAVYYAPQMDGESQIQPTLPGLPLQQFAALTAAPSAQQSAKKERELTRRHASGLTARQNELLQAWGYPFVLDEFRFHCSLTGKLDALTQDQIAAFKTAATSRFDDMPVDKVNSIALFCEPTPGADFRLLQHFLLGGLACA